MSSLLAPVIEPGFFASEAVQTALVVGLIAAVVSATVGVFTVMRAQAFAGHALSDVGATGGSGAFLLGVGPLWGFVAAGLLAAVGMEAIGIQRVRGRDLATGIVLGIALGVAALLLYLDTTQMNTSGATVTVLFGSIFSLARSTVLPMLALSVVALAIVAVLFRPLLLSSLSAEIAAARGLRVRALGAAYLLALAVAVALAAMTIGTILSTALLVGPAAAALRLTRRPAAAFATAAAIGVATTWLGVLLAYDSFYWPPREHGWPVSFFVVALVFCAYLLSGLRRRRL